MRTVRSFCRVCTAVCGILVDVDGDDVIAVHGDPEHPFSRGYTCPKGRALPQLHHRPDRIERPLIRIDDELRPTTWEACLDDLGYRLRAVIAEHGPQAVGINFGTGVGMDATGYRIAQGLHAAIGTPAKFSPLTIDGTAKVLIAELMGGTQAMTGRPDYDNATFVMLVGSNPVVSHGHTVGMPNPRGMLRELAKHAEVWIVDPRHTETARMAGHHLAPRPGTDYAVLGYLVREVLRDGADPSVPIQDLDRLAAAVEPFTLQRSADLADVPEDQLRQLLAAIRRSRRIAVDTGTGITMSPTANVTQWLCSALLIITGSMNRPGGMWFHPGFAYQLETFTLPVASADGSFGPGPSSRPQAQSFLREWPCATLADEIDTGNIRALLNLGGSLVTGFPDAGSLVPALRKLDVLATTEILPNETTALSTHVLATKGQLERPDITMWDFLSPRISAQHTTAVVDPVGERRSMWWVLAEIGRRLGHELADTGATDDAMLATVGSGMRGGYEALTATGWAQSPIEVPAPWVDAHIDRVGGWRLAPRLLLEQLDAVAEPAPLVLVPRRQLSRLNSQLEFLAEAPEVLIHPDDAAAAGLADGAPVAVRTEHGELAGIAKIDPTVKRGAVSVPHGHRGANVNMLTSKDDIDPLTGMTRYSGFAVTVHPG
ncbi:molybdopterin oxidoreductase [Mycolicibacterium moriokaense]|nr:molybdopterin oxidoreductase [Mycolicibacterium moriokaense]